MSSEQVSDTVACLALLTPMSTLGSRIRAAREAAGLSQAKVAEHFGISRNSVSLWESDDSRPDPDKWSALASILDTSVDWLLTAKGDAPVAKPRNRDAFRPQITPGAELVTREALPIYAAAQGGDGHLIISDDAIQHVKMPAILEGVKGAYGILIRGESMEPEFRPGDMALINPHLHYLRDETHVFYDHPPFGEHGDVEAIVKRLLSWTDNTWRLRQFNPPQDFDEARVDWPTCHRVVGKYNRR